MSRQIAQSITVVAVFAVGLLIVGGCWSKKASPETQQQAAEPGGVFREVAAGDYRLKLDLSSQILKISMDEPPSFRGPDTVQADDTVTVVPAATDVRVEDRMVARVLAGQVLPVSEVQGNFVGVSLLVGGTPVAGWLERQEVKFKAHEPKLHATIGALGHSKMVPAAMLIEKAKAFDDGLYAAVELAAEKGSGNFAGKRSLLTALIAAAMKPDQQTAPPLVLLAAGKLGGLPETIPANVEQQVTTTIAAFERDKARSLPISFYTWSAELERIFRQDRMLQTPLAPAEVKMLTGALEQDAKSRTTYEQYLDLTSHLSNPPATQDLRFLLKSGKNTASGQQPVCFFPPSRSFEGDLLNRISPTGQLPAGMSLMDELVARVRSGKIDLSPSDSSGWYDYTAWSLEPLLKPEKTPEAPHLELTKSYREHLESLFKGSLALARETHTKQLPPLGAKEAQAAPQGHQFNVWPELSAEPLPTSYLRRAQGYRFIRKALEETFGRESLAQLHRLRQNGEVKTNLLDELGWMEDLFLGAAGVVGHQLGISHFLPDDFKDRSEAAAKTFNDWSTGAAKDADLAGDLRMMVPVYVEPFSGRIKVWVFLGWTLQPCDIAFAKRPEAEVVDRDGKTVDPKGYTIHWTSASQTLATPVMAELYVTRLLDREQFRKHCDTYYTPSAILANLR